MKMSTCCPGGESARRELDASISRTASRSASPRFRAAKVYATSPDATFVSPSMYTKRSYSTLDSISTFSSHPW